MELARELLNEIIDEIKENNKSKYFKVVRVAKEKFYDNCKTNSDIDSRNMILNAAMVKSLNDIVEQIIGLGAILQNKIAIEFLEELVDAFKEAEKEMMEADNE